MDMQATVRTKVGGGMGALRRAGMVPANVYGKGADSVALAVPAGPLNHLLATASRNLLVHLQVEGGAAPTSETVMVREVSLHPVTHTLQHVSFLRVNAGDSVSGAVEVVLVGEAEAVKMHVGRLVPGLSTLHVKGRPSAMPNRLEVDVTALADPSQMLRVRDLVLPAGLVALDEPDAVVASLAAVRAEGEPGRP